MVLMMKRKTKPQQVKKTPPVDPELYRPKPQLSLQQLLRDEAGVRLEVGTDQAPFVIRKVH